VNQSTYCTFGGYVSNTAHPSESLLAEGELLSCCACPPDSEQRHAAEDDEPDAPQDHPGSATFMRVMDRRLERAQFPVTLLGGECGTDVRGRDCVYRPSPMRSSEVSQTRHAQGVIEVKVADREQLPGRTLQPTQRFPFRPEVVAEVLTDATRDIEDLHGNTMDRPHLIRANGLQAPLLSWYRPDDPNQTRGAGTPQTTDGRHARRHYPTVPWHVGRCDCWLAERAVSPFKRAHPRARVVLVMDPADDRHEGERCTGSRERRAAGLD
jgi:hypothetical protein